MRITYLLLEEPALSETFVIAEHDAVCQTSNIDVEVVLARAGRSWSPRAFVRALGGTRGSIAYRLRNAHLVARSIGRVSATRPDVIHTHFVTAPFLVAAEIARQLGLPVTVLAHAADYRARRAVDASSLVMKLALRRGRGRLLVISEEARAEMRTLGYDESVLGDAEVVRPCVAAQVDSFSEPIAAGSDGIRIVSVARLVDKKGIDRAVRAMKVIATRVPSAHLEVIGDGPLRTQLERLATDAGVADKVDFLGGLPHEEVLVRMRSASAAVLPCRRSQTGDQDGIPVFLVEAAALRIPIVTTDVSGIANLVRPVDGLLEEGATDEQLANAVVTIVEDHALRDERVTAIGKRYHAEFAPAIQVDRLNAVWHDLSAGRACERGST